MTEPLELVRERLRERDLRPGDGKQFDCRCPAHEDRSPSLSVGIGDDGRVLLRCQAGCSTDAVVAALGLELAQLFPAQNGNGDGRRVVATYVYTDAAGEALFRVHRKAVKGFRQDRPDGKGGWEPGSAPPADRVLFRLPQVLAAIKEGQPIWLVEGEKDVLTLERAGVTATTCPMGAGKWRDQYTESLHDAHVIVVADADDPGIEHARHVAKDLAGVAKSVELKRCPGPHKDVHDLLTAGGKLDDLLPLAGEDERAEGARGGAPASAAAALAASRVDLAALIRDGVPPREFIPGSGGALVVGKRHLVFAGPKLGKSITMAVVTALDIIAAGGRVAVLDRENGSDEYARRWKAVLSARGADVELRAKWARNYTYYAYPQFKLEWGKDPDYAQAFDGVTVVIFDSSRRFLTHLGLKESENDDFARFTDALIDPLFEAGIASVILDNTGHENQEHARGASAKADVVDLVFALKQTQEFGIEAEGSVELECKQSRIGEVAGAWEMELGGGHYGSWLHCGGGVSRRQFHNACVEALAEAAAPWAAIR